MKQRTKSREAAALGRHPKIRKFIESREWQYHLLLIPGIIIIFIFCYVPMYGVIIAFQKYNPALGFASKWVGWDNFRFVFSQPNFVRTIWNTLFIASFKLAGGIFVSVSFALLLNEVKSLGYKKAIQTVVYLPNFLSWVVLAGMLIDMLSTDGLVNQVIVWCGGEPISFLGNPSAFPWTMIVSDIWKSFGYGAIVYLAALSNLDPTLYEAAAIDGANKWHQTLHITLPGLKPTIILMAVLSLGSVLNAGFDQIYNLYSPSVYSTGDIIDTYVYRLGIENAQYSISTAVGLFKSLVSCILVGFTNYAAGKFANYRIY